MQYKVILTPEAEEDFSKLEVVYKRKLLEDFRVIREVSMNAVNRNSLGNKLYEIKTDKIRSLFEYRKGQIVVVAVIFLKKEQKTPSIYIERARNILKNYEYTGE